jgi:hypothetical protein
VTADEKARAEQIVKRSGVPFPLALQVVRGKLKLNDVLTEMLTRDRRDRLVKEGVAPSLAGQVVRGRLDLGRARKIQSVWDTQKASLQSDRLKRLAPGSELVLVRFGMPPTGVTLVEMGRYDFQVTVAGTTAPEVVHKHDIKLWCLPEHAPRVLESIGREEKVAAMGLGASTSMADRFRPDEDAALGWVAAGSPVRFLFRDGDTLAGVPVRVARYEVEIDVGGGARAVLLTHALFKDRPYET